MQHTSNSCHTLSHMFGMKTKKKNKNIKYEFVKKKNTTKQKKNGKNAKYGLGMVGNTALLISMYTDNLYIYGI